MPLVSSQSQWRLAQFECSAFCTWSIRMVSLPWVLSSDPWYFATNLLKCRAFFFPTWKLDGSFFPGHIRSFKLVLIEKNPLKKFIVWKVVLLTNFKKETCNQHSNIGRLLIAIHVSNFTFKTGISYNTEPWFPSVKLSSDFVNIHCALRVNVPVPTRTGIHRYWHTFHPQDYTCKREIEASLLKKKNADFLV